MLEVRRKIMSSVAILWDLENVNPGSNSLFLEGLTEYAEAKGRIVAARAYGNWSHTGFSKLAPSLTRRYFYLVHIPKGQKNSSDMVLVSDALEILRVAEHIDTFILVTGDSDFRFLVLALRRAGKTIHIVCNTKNASEDLLALADSYVDYRELVPGGNDGSRGLSLSGLLRTRPRLRKPPHPLWRKRIGFRFSPRQPI